MLQTVILVGVILLIAAIIAVAVAKAQSTHIFVCHRCGQEFQPEWTQLLFEVHAFNEHRIKCPYCNKKVFCTDKGKQPD